MRIDRDILFGLPAARMHDETALWLTRRLVCHDCTENHELRGRAALLGRACRRTRPCSRPMPSRGFQSALLDPVEGDLAVLPHYFDFDAASWKLVRRYVPPKGRLPVKRQYRGGPTPFR